MIPWQLKFSGIRDYDATVMNFGEKDEHVLISGPNGSGKSTIAFCIGAVLHSAKIDVAGLRPHHIDSKKTWNADISIVFKNDGLQTVDDPLFFQFSLKIIQRPDEPIQKEYRISVGDNIKNLKKTTLYIAEDPFYNFSQYKQDLRFKYKIDPDAFYSIWYQQEVSLFVKMTPEERFRMFSEMYGIEKTQRDWEKKVAQVQDAQQSLISAEKDLQLEKMELDRLKSSLTLFNEHRQRLKENGSLYNKSLMQFKVFYGDENERHEYRLQQLEAELKKEESLLTKQYVKVSQLEERLEQLQQDEKDIHQEIKFERKNLTYNQETIAILNEQIEDLEKELETSEVENYMPMASEQDLDGLMVETCRKIEATRMKLEYETTKYDEQLSEWEAYVQQIAQLTVEIKSDEQAEKKHKERLEKYKSSHFMMQQIKMLEVTQRGDFFALNEISQQKQALQQELAMLKKNVVFSDRQLQSLKYCRQNGIQAFSLRDLLELDKTASRKAEQRFNAIKYTIFFVGREIIPPNDLYHVPLPKVIPDRAITALPSLQLKVRSGLSERRTVYAMKALWWVEQLFLGRNAMILDGVLCDSYGLRGSQEEEMDMLSEKALHLRVMEIQKSFDKLDGKERALRLKVAKDVEHLQLLNSAIQGVREAEAFFTHRNESLLKSEKLSELTQEKEQNELVRVQRSRRLHALRQRFAEQIAEMDNLRSISTTAEQMEALKPTYEALEKNRYELKREQKTESERVQLLETMEEARRRKIEMIRVTSREHEEAVHSKDQLEKKYKQIKKQHEQTINNIKQIRHEQIQNEKALKDLHRTVPKLHKRGNANLDISAASMTKLKHDLETAKQRFDAILREEGIDPEVQDNYRIATKNYGVKKEEYEALQLHLEQELDRLIKLEDLLEKTIQTRVETVQQKFQSYMELFQFEGDISWERYTDSSNMDRFRLFIQARKEGQAGQMVGLNVQKHNEKIGSGMSGGEESLCSLLFVLALLQNLQTSPNFIVLDEFDSALDEKRKLKVFELFTIELKRKLIILSPKSHNDTFVDKFSCIFSIKHNRVSPRSKVKVVQRSKRTKDEPTLTAY